MNNRKILILHPDYTVHRQYAKEPDVELLFNAKEFDALARSIKDDFTFYIEEMNKQFQKNVDWWVTSLPSRDTIGSFIFQDICYALYAKKLLETVKISEIVCSSHRLRQTILKIAGSYCRIKIAVHNVVNSNGGTRELLRSFLRTDSKVALFMIDIYIALKFLLHAVKRHLAARKSRIGNISRLDVEGAWLLDVFVFKSSFANNKFESRHFRRMPYLVEGKWVYMANFIDIADFDTAFRIMRSNNPAFVVKEDYLQPSDYIWTIGHLLRVRFLKIRFRHFHSIDLSPVLLHYLLHDNLASRYAALLNYRFPLRLRQKDVAIGLVLDWFENQIVDKAQNMGFHRWYPEVPIIGYEMPFISGYGMFLQPTCVEKEIGAVPDVIGVIGKGVMEYVRYYNEKLATTKVPAFAYESSRENLIPVCTKQKHAALALPMVTRMALDMLGLVNEMIKNYSSDIIWYLRFHPSSEREVISQFLKNEGTFDSFVIADSPIGDLFGQVKLVVSTASGVIMDALSYGVPVIIAGSGTELTHNPVITKTPEYSPPICYSPAEIFENIRYIMNLDEEAYAKLSYMCRKVAEDYFEPVNTETVRDFQLVLSDMTSHKKHRIEAL